MTEATHADIMNRVAAVEAKQSDMAAQLAAVRQDAKAAVDGVEHNRNHFDNQLDRLKSKQDQTHSMLEKHVVEVKTQNATIITMGKALVAVVGFGVTLITLVELVGR